MWGHFPVLLPYRTVLDLSADSALRPGGGVALSRLLGWVLRHGASRSQREMMTSKRKRGDGGAAAARFQPVLGRLLQPEPPNLDVARWLDVDSIAKNDIRVRLRYVPVALGQLDAPTAAAPLMGFTSMSELLEWQASDVVAAVSRFEHMTKGSDKGSWPVPLTNRGQCSKVEDRQRKRPDLPSKKHGLLKRVWLMANKVTRGICRNAGPSSLVLAWSHWPNMKDPVVQKMTGAQLAVYTTNVAHAIADAVGLDGGRLVRIIGLEPSSTDRWGTTVDGHAIPHSHTLILIPVAKAGTVRDTVSSMLRQVCPPPTLFIVVDLAGLTLYVYHRCTA